MSGETTWWACAVIEPKNKPEVRLATALELARMAGVATDTVFVSATAVETRAPAGVTLVADEHVPANQFRFVRDGGAEH
ncbi:MAG: hypothetical protein ACRDJC_10555 [Thermomicrobiales bacterium]